MDLIDAVIMSSHKGKPVDIPVDRDGYEEFIEGLRKTSKVDESAQAKRITDPQHRQQ